MILRSKKIRGWTVVLIAGLLGLPLHLHAQSKTTPAVRKKSSSARHSASKQGAASKSSGQRVKASRRPRRSRYRRRLAQLHLEPQRIAEIQRALAQAGYLNQESTGKWNEATKAAMRRFQADHGFPTTALPEAKSLMKLGLGPHALPEDIESEVTARAGVEPSAKPLPPTATDPPPGQDPPKSDPPRKNK